MWKGYFAPAKVLLLWEIDQWFVFSSLWRMLQFNLLKFMCFLMLPLIANRFKRTDSWSGWNKLGNLLSFTFWIYLIYKNYCFVYDVIHCCFAVNFCCGFEQSSYWDMLLSKSILRLKKKHYLDLATVFFII